MTKETLLIDLAQSTGKLIASLSNFTPENFNEKPSAEEWSAAEVAEHLLKLEVIANKAMRSEAVPTNRPPDQKIFYLNTKMEDKNKRKAPEPVLPSGETKDLPAILEQLREQREALKVAIQTLDETAACIGAKHPVAGTLTRMEWVYFVIYHTERHLKQLEQLAARVAC